MTDGGIKITFEQMYQEVQQTHSEVREMRAEVRTALASVDDHEKRLRTMESAVPEATSMQDTVRNDHGPRIRAVERRLYYATGVAAVIGAGGAAALSEMLRAWIGG